MKKKLYFISFGLGLFVLLIVLPESVKSAPAVNLNQARNGTDTLPVNPMNWVNGNLGSGTAHYTEGMSTPFQCVMTGLTIGVQVTLTIGYDIKNGGKHAYDYLTHYNHLLPHPFIFHSTPEVINPLAGTSLAANTPFTLYIIPCPSSAGSPVSGMPSNSYYWSIPDSERTMTLYNGTIDTIYYLVQGNLTSSQSETQVVIKFTPSAATVVLLWGGHIASRNDWGFTNGIPNSAGGISGSPFHMRLVAWSLGNIGNQDRSLAGGTVTAPINTLPIALVNFSGENVPQGVQLNWSTASEINNDYFIVERSSENENFQAIAIINGSGNSNSLLNYSFLDESPASGTSYYRLVQSDFDGTKKIYGPICARTGDSPFSLSLINVYPNPATGNFYLTYRSEDQCKTLLEILNAEGKRMYSEALHSVRGTNFIEINDEKLPAEGIYFVRLSQDKVKSHAEKIVKK